MSYHPDGDPFLIRSCIPEGPDRYIPAEDGREGQGFNLVRDDETAWGGEAPDIVRTIGVHSVAEGAGQVIVDSSTEVIQS